MVLGYMTCKPCYATRKTTRGRQLRIHTARNTVRRQPKPPVRYSLLPHRRQQFDLREKGTASQAIKKPGDEHGLDILGNGAWDKPNHKERERHDTESHTCMSG